MIRKINKISDLTSIEKELIYYIYIHHILDRRFVNKFDNMEKKIEYYVYEITHEYQKNKKSRRILPSERVICQLCWNNIELLAKEPNTKMVNSDITGFINHYFSFNEDISIQQNAATLGCLVKSKIVDRLVEDNIAYYQINKNYLPIINDMLNELNKYLTAIENLPNENVENIDDIINNYKKTLNTSNFDYDTKKLTNNKEKLIDYIKSIVSLESDILSLKKRYNSLAKERTNLITSDYFLELSKANEEIEFEINEIKKDIKYLSDKINNKPKLREDDNIVLPQKPVFNLYKPIQPPLKKANIFNRKKVEEENRIKIQQFNEAMLKYNNEYEKYTKELNDYNDRIKEIVEANRKQNEKLYQEELKKYNSEVQDYKLMLDKKDTEMKNLVNNSQKRIEEILKDSDSYNKLKSVEYELEYIIENIKKNIELQNKMYRYNIIYGKYRNYVTLSSFIDYFMSGRCSSLSGADGAYNLYEQESRADIIINKLDVIIDSLEKIKENQYYIYNELQTINNSLDLINAQLLVNNILQVVQISELNKIIENTNEIAYNTKVTAYYAEKNANYTKALTVMQFLDKL